VIPMTLAEVAATIGGTLGGGADPTAVVTRPLVFDSRHAEPGGLFLAIAGTRVDGHDFAAAAISNGAVAALVTRPLPVAHVLVQDPLTALAALARTVAARLIDTVVIGVTGSSGKTSTKDLIAALLERAGPTVAPPGSYNNELGHPYTVLLADQQTRFLVLENSARGLGHIRYLTQIARPRIGVVLNVGRAHLGEFGSTAAIAAAKGELVEALPAAADGGIAVLNADDPLVMAMSARTAARVVMFGWAADADVGARDVELDRLGRAAFVLHARGQAAPVRLRLSGARHVSNALAASAVALECGLPIADVADALSSAAARSQWRMQVTERPDGVIVINDAYNANPDSTAAALETLAATAHRGASRTIAVLGGMAELGSDAAAEHEAIGRLVATLSIDRLIAVGEDARPIVAGSALAGYGPDAATEVPDCDAALALLRGYLAPGDVVLVKASRAAALERVALALEHQPTTAEPKASRT
jgi:UDP-N-acetylmuramoyl-tripeptide--D-alanyl-D-alanine ligase